MSHVLNCDKLTIQKVWINFQFLRFKKCLSLLTEMEEGLRTHFDLWLWQRREWRRAGEAGEAVRKRGKAKKSFHACIFSTSLSPSLSLSLSNATSVKQSLWKFVLLPLKHPLFYSTPPTWSTSYHYVDLESNFSICCCSTTALSKATREGERRKVSEKVCYSAISAASNRWSGTLSKFLLEQTTFFWITFLEKLIMMMMALDIVSAELKKVIFSTIGTRVRALEWPSFMTALELQCECITSLCGYNETSPIVSICQSMKKLEWHTWKDPNISSLNVQ